MVKRNITKKSEFMKNSDYVAKLRKAVLQLDLNGNVVNEYNSSYGIYKQTCTNKKMLSR